MEVVAGPTRSRPPLCRKSCLCASFRLFGIWSCLWSYRSSSAHWPSHRLWVVRGLAVEDLRRRSASEVQLNSPTAASTPAGHDRAAADRHGVIRFQHRRKISSILIRNTLVPIAIRTAPGSCLVIEGVESPKIRSCLVSIIPLDVQRRCEQRWAARFARRAPETSSQKSKHEKQGQQRGAPAKPKGKPAGPGSILRSSNSG